EVARLLEILHRYLVISRSNREFSQQLENHGFMPELLILFGYSQSTLQLVSCFGDFALAYQRLGLAFIRHEGKPCIRVRTARLYGAFEERKRFAVSLGFVKAVAEHFEVSNLSTHIATRHRRKECIPTHCCAAAAVPLKTAIDP